MRLRDFQQDFNRNFKKISELFGSMTEELSSSLQQPHLKRLLNSALDLLRPYHVAIGARFRRLTRSQIEAVLPARAHNMNSNREIEEGTLVSLAQQMVKLIIARWEVAVESHLDAIEIIRLQALQGDLTARLDWNDLSREAFRSELVKNDWVTNTWQVAFFDGEEKHVADVRVTFRLRLTKQLKGKGSHGGHSKRN